jgi:hypothetical protein
LPLDPVPSWRSGGFIGSLATGGLLLLPWS